MNKVQFEHQIVKQEQMEHHYHKYINTLRKKTGAWTTSRSDSSSDAGDNASPRRHYSVAKKDRDHVDLYNFPNKHMGDPTLKVSDILTIYCSVLTVVQNFVVKLKDHLLTCILNKQYDPNPPMFTTKDRDKLYITKD